MATEKTEFEKGYLLGFYNALKGVSFIAGAAEDVTEVREAVDDIIQEMIDEGEVVPDSDGTADALVEVLELFTELGVDPTPLLDSLTKLDGGK